MTKRVLVSASGTGGHLMPALHIMRSLQKHGAEVLFVGSGRPLEEKLIGGAGIECRVIPTVGLKNRGFAGLFEFLGGVPRALSLTRALFREYRPDIVLGVGGYATFFPLLLASLTGVSSWVHESEKNPGLANRVLSFFVNRISLAFSETTFPFMKRKLLYTGQPVREEIYNIAGQSKHVDRPHKLLVLGGSQGARAIDHGLMEIAPFLKKHLIHVWHQARPENCEEVEERYHELEIHHRVVPFIDDMAEAYRWADIIVSRAGAGAVMEIGLINRPTIFVPLPSAQGDHQTKNAEILVQQGKAYIVKEGEAFTEELMKSLEKLLQADQYNRIRLRAVESRPVNASETIAQELLG